MDFARGFPRANLHSPWDALEVKNRRANPCDSGSFTRPIGAVNVNKAGLTWNSPENEALTCGLEQRLSAVELFGTLNGPTLHVRPTPENRNPGTANRLRKVVSLRELADPFPRKSNPSANLGAGYELVNVDLHAGVFSRSTDSRATYRSPSARESCASPSEAGLIST
jgi:hypothetical protein